MSLILKNLVFILLVEFISSDEFFLKKAIRLEPSEAMIETRSSKIQCALKCSQINDCTCFKHDEDSCFMYDGGVCFINRKSVSSAGLLLDDVYMRKESVKQVINFVDLFSLKISFLGL